MPLLGSASAPGAAPPPPTEGSVPKPPNGEPPTPGGVPVGTAAAGAVPPSKSCIPEPKADPAAGAAAPKAPPLAESPPKRVPPVLRRRGNLLHMLKCNGMPERSCNPGTAAPKRRQQPAGNILTQHAAATHLRLQVPGQVPGCQTVRRLPQSQTLHWRALPQTEMACSQLRWRLQAPAWPRLQTGCLGGGRVQDGQRVDACVGGIFLEDGCSLPSSCLQKESTNAPLACGASFQH